MRAAGYGVSTQRSAASLHAPRAQSNHGLPPEREEARRWKLQPRVHDTSIPAIVRRFDYVANELAIRGSNGTLTAGDIDRLATMLEMDMPAPTFWTVFLARPRAVPNHVWQLRQQYFAARYAQNGHHQAR